MVRSSYFEAFLAYQQFMLAWSRQFSTPFTFTFMPELYPGGHVGFPDHGLQMYIEEVEHRWDYESGFTTQASLSAPSVLMGDDGKPVNTDNLPPTMVNALVPSAPLPVPPDPFVQVQQHKKTSKNTHGGSGPGVKTLPTPSPHGGGHQAGP